MKPDYEYIKTILDVFIKSEKAAITVNDFSFLYKKNNEKFVFHIELLNDKNLINNPSNPANNLGIQRSGNDASEFMFSACPWRSTAEGHDFANALNKPGIFKTILSRFKNEDFSAIIDVAKNLTKKQITKLIGELND